MKLFNRFRFSQELKRRVRENAALGKPLSIMDDLVFKAMLSSDTEDSREALRSLLSACTRREVSTVCVTTNEPIPAHLEAKAVRLDVNVTFNDGEAANLEMQFSASGDDLIARAVLYAAMLQSSQSRKGGAYKRIRRVYQIFFLNLILFPDSDKLPRRYSYREEIEHDLLTEAVEIIFYELPKLERRVQDYLKGKTGIECLPEDEKWCMYMKYRHEERAAKLIERLYREEEGIMRAERAVSGISKDYLKAIREMNILKNRMDRATEQDNAREAGLQEGLQTGRAEKAMEIARKMKKVGDSAERIQDITGLSPEAIEKL